MLNTVTYNFCVEYCLEDFSRIGWSLLSNIIFYKFVFLEISCQHGLALPTKHFKVIF